MIGFVDIQNIPLDGRAIIFSKNNRSAHFVASALAVHTHLILATGIVMLATMRCTILLTCIVINMISCFAIRDLTDTLGYIACSGSYMACQCIAVHALRSTVGIVILTEIFFISPGRLLADISSTLFCFTYSGRTDLLDGTGLAGIAINSACRAALGIDTLTRQRIHAETALTGCGDTFSVLACPGFPACELGTVIIL